MLSALSAVGFCQLIPWWMIQTYWVIWLVLSFVVSFTLGAVILHNWECTKG